MKIETVGNEVFIDGLDYKTMGIAIFFSVLPLQFDHLKPYKVLGVAKDIGRGLEVSIAGFNPEETIIVKLTTKTTTNAKDN
jgi:hypothetical protein